MHCIKIINILIMIRYITQDILLGNKKINTNEYKRLNINDHG
jgi:hypothetical protein